MPLVKDGLLQRVRAIEVFLGLHEDVQNMDETAVPAWNEPSLVTASVSTSTADLAGEDLEESRRQKVEMDRVLNENAALRDEINALARRNKGLLEETATLREDSRRAWDKAHEWRRVLEEKTTQWTAWRDEYEKRRNRPRKRPRADEVDAASRPDSSDSRVGCGPAAVATPEASTHASPAQLQPFAARTPGLSPPFLTPAKTPSATAKPAAHARSPTLTWRTPSRPAPAPMTLGESAAVPTAGHRNLTPQPTVAGESAPASPAWISASKCTERPLRQQRLTAMLAHASSDAAVPPSRPPSQDTQATQLPPVAAGAARQPAPHFLQDVASPQRHSAVPMPHRNTFLESFAAAGDTDDDMAAQQSDVPLSTVDCLQNLGVTQSAHAADECTVAPAPSEEVSRKAFKYEEVVRKKADREKLHGTDCPCCTKVRIDLQPCVSHVASSTKSLVTSDRQRLPLMRMNRQTRKPQRVPWTSE